MTRSISFFFASLVLAAAAASAQIGRALSEQKINMAQGGFVGPLADRDNFGSSIAAIGDLDRDGVPDVAVSAPRDDDGGLDTGAVWILFLNPDRTVKAEQKISATQGGLVGGLPNQAWFGYGMTSVGDLDGDGDLELAVTQQNPNLVQVLFLNQDGTVQAQGQIEYADPVFNGQALARDFGVRGIDDLGDLDGDGFHDLVLGAPNDDDGPGTDRGAVWIVRMGGDGFPVGAHKISSTQGGFGGELEPGDNFGGLVTALGDIDGDGGAELLVSSVFTLWTLHLDEQEFVISETARNASDYGLEVNGNVQFPGIIQSDLDLDGDGVREIGVPLGLEPQGAFGLAYLKPDGDVRKRFLLASETNGVPPLPPGSRFGTTPTFIGDLDGDGNPEIAAGAAQDGEVPMRRGAIWIFTIDGDSARNGSGVNPMNLRQRLQPRVGNPWDLQLDCSAHAPGLAILAGWSAAIEGQPTPFGELLVDVNSNLRFVLQSPHAQGPVLFAPVIPLELALIDEIVSLQGVCTGAPGIQFSNALDVVIGE